jgi:hypothetical protein
MSKYRVHKGVVQSVQAVLCAIEDRIVAKLSRGMTAEQKAERIATLKANATQIVKNNVRVDLTNPMHLEGYHGDMRTETANIVIPRSLVNQFLGGGASNDVGFTKTPDGFDAIVSEYDKGSWWNGAADRFWQVAATHEAVEAATLNGYTVETVEDENGNIQVYCDSQF